MTGKYDALKLENQICFPLYACAKEVVKKYKPYLDELDLTYTQYIVMMVVWEHKELTEKTMGDKLFLDSGTLTPVLKTLEKKGFLCRKRYEADERVLVVSATEKGMKLRETAVDVPKKVGACIDLSQDDAYELYRILYRILDDIRGK